MMEHAPSGIPRSSNCCSHLQSHLVRSYTLYAGPLLAMNLPQLPEKRSLSGRFNRNPEIAHIGEFALVQWCI